MRLRDSMSPVIEKGSLLFVKEKDTYETGDIVAFYAPYGGQVLCVTHRIVDKAREGGYITKGDANDREDRLIVRGEQICGQVTGVHSSVWVHLFFRTEKQYFFAAVFPFFTAVERLIFGVGRQVSRATFGIIPDFSVQSCICIQTSAILLYIF